MSRKLAKACLRSMFERVADCWDRARAARELLALGRIDEAMNIAYKIEPLLYEANHLMQSASLLRREGGER